MKRLIVNADDLGADEQRNAGIFEAIGAGFVTSVSILSNGIALEDALSKIQSLAPRQLSFGIHLNLSEGKPRSSGLKLLVGPDGCFLGKKKARQMLLHKGDPELENEIRRELDSQISILRRSGVHLDHYDGHQHIHLFPAVLKIAMDRAKENGIRWVRIPDEPPTAFKPGVLSASDVEEAAFFSEHAQIARPLVRPSGFFAPDHFRGLLFKGKLPSSYWVEFLEGIPHGLTELMVHPGYAANPATGPFSGFSTPDREGELKSLTDGRFREALLKTTVELSAFPEAPIQ